MVDQVGNRLGSRKYVGYTSDGGQDYAMLLDASVSEAVGNEDPVDDASIIQASAKRPLTPRYCIFAKKDDPVVKKRVIIGDPQSEYMTATTATEVEINGVDWYLTSRHGEKQAVPPPKEDEGEEPPA